MKRQGMWFKLGMVAAAVIFMSSVGLAADKKTAAKPAPAAKEAAVNLEGKKSDVKAEVTVELIDLNRATKDQLRVLDGIGEAYSQKIIDGRPYAKKDQLKSRKILPDALYDKIKDKVIAKQPPKKK